MSILVTGGAGMLASEIKKYEALFATEMIYTDKDTLDITDDRQIVSFLEKHSPSCIINCAAYTNVDEAEDSGKSLNLDINARWAYLLAKHAYQLWIDFITISTDYVFDGTQEKGYLPQDQVCPLNNYGLAKALWERLVHDSNPNAIIARTSRLYGWGIGMKNFVNTMIRLSTEKKEVSIIHDQYGNPTSAGDLAQALALVFATIDKYRWQILHLTNTTDGHGVSWYNFACEIFRLIGSDIICHSISSEQYTTKAKRPQWSKLINESNIPMRSWQEGLMAYIEELKAR